MIYLFLPYILGLAIGIEPPAPPATNDQTPATVTVLPQDQGSGDDLGADLVPEPQIATGTFTTALEVRPILTATKPNWIGVREYEGQDLIYFTNLMAWRCGLWDIRYGINGAPANRVVPMEPCYDDQPQPNVMLDVEMFSPFVVHPLGSVESVTVEIVYDDGTVDRNTYARAAVQIP